MGDSLKKITFVIPVYNGVNYIDRIIGSILNQRYDNVELILVDDGSKDDSLQKCRQYEKNDNRVRVIHQENQGESSARNTGIRNATGDYVALCDQDDDIDTDALVSLMHYANTIEPDVIRGNFCIHYGPIVNKYMIQQPYGIMLDRKYILDEIIPYTIGIKYDEEKKIHGHWTLITKRSLLHENNVLYDETMKKEDDHKFLVNVLAYANSIVFDDGCYYHWLKRQESHSRSYSPRFANICKNFAFYQQLFSQYYDFFNQEKIRYNIDFLIESAEYVVLHKKDCNAKEELFKILSSSESKEWFSLLNPRNSFELRLKNCINNRNFSRASSCIRKNLILVRFKHLIKKLLKKR